MYNIAYLIYNIAYLMYNIAYLMYNIAYLIYNIAYSMYNIAYLMYIKVITKLPNSEQSYKGKVKTHNYINRQNQSTTGKLWKP
jgi:hypothetical protein